jgi:predicted nucleotidyltransferase component of viral defense system
MMSHLDLLPEATKALWLKLRDEPLLKGGILIGGTALTLRIGHRRSEDLDFAFLSERLPHAAINLLLRKYPDWIRNDNLLSYEEFQIAGQSLHDYQQDFVSGDAVKITFLAEEKPVWAILDHASEHSRPLRVATTKEIFGLKCLVSARRSKSRDHYDLYVLFQEHGFGVSDMVEAFEKANRSAEIDIAFRRLCSGITAPDDEGYEALIENPPSKEVLKEYFQRLRDRYEIEQSRILKDR